MPLSIYYLESGLKTTILSFITMISGTIYRPAKCVIMTGQSVITFFVPLLQNIFFLLETYIVTISQYFSTGKF